MRKPFYKKQMKRWYVWFNGRQVPLGTDEAKAYAKWQRMLDAAQEPADPDICLLAVANRFIKESRGTISDGRLKQYASYIVSVCREFGDKPAAKLSKGEFSRWVAKQEQWSDWGKRDCIDTILRVYRWATVEQGILNKNPLSGIRKPTPKARSRIVSPAEHEAMVRASLESKENAREFALYLIASRCGARPQDVRRVEAKHVHKLDAGVVWVFDEHKTAHKGHRRVVYLTPCLSTLMQILIESRPSGPLFVQENGRPWSRHTAARRFKRIRESLGIDKSLKLYSYRHTYATEALVNGASLAETAELLGHKDTRMVSRTYGHLDQHSNHMLERAASVYRKREAMQQAAGQAPQEKPAKPEASRSE